MFESKSQSPRPRQHSACASSKPRGVRRGDDSRLPTCEAMEPRLLLAGDISVTVHPLATADTTPDLTGTISDPLAAVKVRVDGKNYDATNNGDGTWALAGSSFTLPLANGTYDVLILATNGIAGTFGVDETSNELVINTTAPVVAVNELITNALRPGLTGTVNDSQATISVTVGGKAYSATNNKNGTWSLASNVVSVLSEGLYDVAVTATDTDGHVGTDDTTDELTIDRAKPVVTVDALLASVASPKLTGSLDDPDATLSLTVNGRLYSPVNNGDGTWTLAAGTISSLSPGRYDVEVTAFDKAGNVGTDATDNELEIRLPPVVTVDRLATTDTTPGLSGTVNDPTATISVNVDGADYDAVNHGNGTWTLADDTIAPLSEGIYDVVATATSTAALEGTDATTYELVVDFTPPAVTVNALTTKKTAPDLSGSVDEPDATVVVTLNGKEYTATNNGNGTWSLAGSKVSALTPGVYDVAVKATDAAGNEGTDATTDELGILPVVTVNGLTTTDTTPRLTGTVTASGATISVNVNGADYAAVNNGNGTWTLADDTIASLTDGVYEVTATATLGALVGTDSTINELTIDTTAPALTVKAQDPTTSTRPEITGTVGESSATITVAVAGKTYTAVNFGDGTWKLAANTITALSAGSYLVTVTATDAAGNKNTAQTTIQIVVLPIIQVDKRSTTDRTPRLTGTVSSPTATISVRVNGVDYAAVNNGDGTWTLADNTIASLPDGTYDVVATATIGVNLKSTDSTTGELVIDTTAPTVTVNELETADTTPDLTGTVTEAGATVVVTLNGKEYAATNNGNGTWSLAGSKVSALTPGVYDVAVKATDAAGNKGTDATTDELGILPVVTVNKLTTTDTTPELTGTVSSPTATISVNVNGVDYAATNNGDGTWMLADDTIAALPEGVYEVAATATLGSLSGTDSTTNELTVDTTAPALTVNTQDWTTSTRPEITGTIGDPNATISVKVAGKTYTAVNFGDGTWKLAANTITALAAGSYAVTVTATDTAGNKSTAQTTIQIVMLPIIRVDKLATTDRTPSLTGTVSSPTATISVRVNGADYAALNNGDGTWTVADDTIASLPDGTYDVVATATIGANLRSTDSTTGELVIDTTAPIVKVNPLEAEATKPDLTGTVTQADATVEVTVNGKKYTAANNGNGTWTLAGTKLSALTPGVYDVAVKATDPAGNVGTDATTNELRILPVVTVDSLATSDTTPKLTGTLTGTGVTISVKVNGVDYAATNNGDGTWTLADNAIAVLAEGGYDVAVTATRGTLSNTDHTYNELTIDTTAPRLTVKAQDPTTNTRPAITGTVGEPDATVAVDVAGRTYAAVSNGDGTWTLAANTITALSVGRHAVTATAKDSAGNKGTASRTIEILRIPTVTVNPLTTTYRSPKLTGLVDDPEAAVTAAVNGNVYDATNNGDGTWVLEAGTISALGSGTYDVSVYAMDTQGNWGEDATLDELRVVGQTTVTMSHAVKGSSVIGVAYLYYTDPDGTKVYVYVSDPAIPGGITLRFDSNSLITVTYKGVSTNLQAAYVTCSGGAVLASMYVYTNTPTVSITTSGGTVAGATIGGISGGAVINTLNANTMDLIGNGIYMPAGTIKALYLRSIKDADVTMFGVVGKTISLTVSRSIVGSNITITDGSIQTFTAGSMIDSSLYVGVMGTRDDNGDGVADLPNVADLRKGFQIATLTITGYTGAVGDLFVNSNIAADKLGTVTLMNARLSNQPDTNGDGEPDDAHQLFGLTANSLKSLQLKQGKKTYRWSNGLWLGGLDPLDLKVRLS